MNTYERQKLKQFLQSNPLLTSDKPIARALIYSEVDKVVKKEHSSETKYKQLCIKGELIGNIEILIQEINKEKTRTLN
jgi:glutaredoxin-related protein